MKTQSKKNFQLFFGLILLALVGWASVWLIIQLVDGYNQLNEGVQTGVIAAIPIISVATIGYFANKSLERGRSVEQALRPRKLKMYEEFIAFLMTIFGNEKVGKRPSEAEMMKFFAKKTPDLITFASSPVIEKWGKLRIGLNDNNSNEEKLFIVEDLLKEIRSDLGHSKRHYHRGDILRLFINDIDEYIKK